LLEIRGKESSLLPIHMNKLSSFLKVYQVPIRPISDISPTKLFFELEGTLYPVSSQKLYLDIRNEKLTVSESVTNSYLEIGARHNDILEVDQFCELDEPFSKRLHEKYSLPIKLLKTEEIFSEVPFLDVQNWEFLGLDELENLKGNSVYLIKAEDKLYNIQANSSLFYDKSWKTGTSASDPCIFFKEVSNEKMKLELWGKEDSFYNDLEIKRKYLPKKNLRISEIISDIHMRNKDQITFVIEKHKIFLKVGEIAVKRNGKWTLLSDAVDDFQNEMYIHLKEIKKNRDIVINVLEKNRVVVHNFIVPVSRGSFSKKPHPLG